MAGGEAGTAAGSLAPNFARPKPPSPAAGGARRGSALERPHRAGSAAVPGHCSGLLRSAGLPCLAGGGKVGGEDTARKLASSSRRVAAHVPLRLRCGAGRGAWWHLVALGGAKTTRGSPRTSHCASDWTFFAQLLICRGYCTSPGGITLPTWAAAANVGIPLLKGQVSGQHCVHCSSPSVVAN